jgi:hypothetical protein
MSVDASDRQFGWIKEPAGFTVYAAKLPAADEFWDSLRAKDDGGDRFSYRALVLCLQDGHRSDWLVQDGPCSRLRSYDQGNIGSCVGNADAKRFSYMAALDIFLRLDAEQFAGMGCPEICYGLSREMAGMLGRGDGSTGYGMAQANTSLGSLAQAVYGAHDLRRYSINTCRQFGLRGVPTEIKALAAEHKYGQYLRVDTAEKAWLCAGAGLPLNQCSSVGWDDPHGRDADGSLRMRGSWSHSMCVGAARRTTKSGRKLILIDQSWGDQWIAGPYYQDQPAGSFYADLDAVGEAVSEGDSFVDLGFLGYNRPAVPLSFTAA